MNSIFKRNGAGSGDVSKPQRPITLYVIRLSPGCRAVWLYLIQNNIPYTLVDVDIITSVDEEESKARNKLPTGCPPEGVPVLIDGDINVFGVHSVLRYLSSRYCNYQGFGKTLSRRMQVESLLEWAENELHRILGHRCIYPQISQRYRLPSNLATEQLIETGFKELAVVLEFLESKLAMGAVSGSSSPSPSLHYLCGGEPTIADYFVATILMQTELVSFDLRLWPNMQSWFEKVQTQKFWHEIHEVHYDFIKQLKKMEDDGSPF